MDYKLGSATGTKSRRVGARFLPEVILTLGMKSDEVDSYSPKEKNKFIRNFAENFNHYEFYSDLTNDLRKNQALYMDNMLKGLKIENKEDFISLYLKIDHEENDFTSDLKVQLEEIKFENNNKQKAKRNQRPQYTPKPSMGGDDEKNKKEKLKYSPAKLKM